MTKPSSHNLTGPPPLEQLGALCSLLAHDLANQLCVISGSASFAQLVSDDPRKLAAALDAITRACETASHAVSSFGEYRRTLPMAFTPSHARQIVEGLREFAEKAGWRCSLPREVEGSVLLPPQWVVFAASSIKTEIYSKPVTLRVSANDTGQPGSVDAGVTDVPTQSARFRPGLHVQFIYHSAQAFSIKDVRTRHENLGLLAAFELNRMLGGEIDSRTPSRGKQEIDLWLPFVASGG
jgi:hypothetical protein